MPGTILIVDDETVLVRHLARILRSQGYRTVVAANGAEARTQMEAVFPDVVLMDLHLPDANGSDLVAELSKRFPQSTFIIITADGSVKSAVGALKRGAVDYLAKPFEAEEMLLAIQQALERRKLSEQLTAMRRPLGVEEIGPPLWPSAPMREVMTLARRAASQSSVVLVLGESGTGKNWLTRWIHRQSSRANGPFFVVNCAAVSRDLAESEMFGHEPGAFTGARGRKRGLLELADGGTLVLDEVGDMEQGLQAKLLTFLDTQSFVRVGGEETIRVDTRIFACTNADIEERVRQGRFRQDLFYRLNVLPIRMPPLRARRDDVPLLAKLLLDRLSQEMRLSPKSILSGAALLRLADHDWPGNIRELRNVLERAAIVSEDGLIKTLDLPDERSAVPQDFQLAVPFPEGKSLHEVTSQVARELIGEALRRGGTKQEAASLLGLSRHALAHQMKALGLKD